MEFEFIEGEIFEEGEVVKNTFDYSFCFFLITRFDDEKYPSVKNLFLKLFFIEVESL